MLIKKALIMAGILGWMMGFFGKGSAMSNEYIISDIYRDLRSKILSIDPSKIGLSPSDSNRIWGVLMETGYPEAVATLVTIADGTVSLYFSNGGGIIGVGGHDGPRNACQSFLSLAPDYITFAKQTQEFPLPKKGSTRFYFLTYDGIFTVENKEDDLGNKRLPLSPLFLLAHEVITQARIVDDHLRTSLQNLINAASTGDVSRVKKLLEEGATPNRSDKTGLSPLMAAAYNGKDEVMKILIQHGCSIDGRDNSGYTALIFASNTGHVNSAKLLIEEGANVNAKDNDGSTPIMFAAQHGHNKLVSLLLKNGADPTITGNHGLSAIGFARQNGYKETEEILRGK